MRKRWGLEKEEGKMSMLLQPDQTLGCLVFRKAGWAEGTHQYIQGDQSVGWREANGRVWVDGGGKRASLSVRDWVFPAPSWTFLPFC
jgi:hypothetical protein